jgi:hypothetical protein
MNEAKKLTLSKETLHCLDDDDLTGVVGGWHHNGGNSNNCNNNYNSDRCSGLCVSFQCQSGVCSLAFFC